MFKNWLKKIDWLLVLNIFFLIAFSLAVLYSLSVDQPFDFSNLFVRQLLFTIVGFFVALTLSIFDYRWLKNYYKIFLAIAFVLLLVVLFLVDPIRGITGWLEFGGQTFQPAELAKLAVIIFLAYYFSDSNRDYYQFKHIIITGGIVGVLTVLVVLQPDFGSAFIIFATWLVMLFFTKTPKKHFFILFILLVVAAVFLWNFVLVDYQKARLTTFLQPASDALGQGYNVQQSIIAVGSGQTLGRGLGLGSQSQLNFLPEQYSDFIFAVVAESLGLWGTWLLLLLYFLFFIKLVNVIKRCGDAFGSWLALGILILFTLQVLINIAMSMGMAPVTGITLPFISYGGSSLLISFVILGIVLSIILKRREKLFTN